MHLVTKKHLLLHRAGLPGKSCLLRAVCEVDFGNVTFGATLTITKVAEAGGLSNQGLAGRALQALLLMEHTGHDDGLVRSMCDACNMSEHTHVPNI